MQQRCFFLSPLRVDPQQPSRRLLLALSPPAAAVAAPRGSTGTLWAGILTQNNPEPAAGLPALSPTLLAKTPSLLALMPGVGSRGALLTDPSPASLWVTPAVPAAPLCFKKSAAALQILNKQLKPGRHISAVHFNLVLLPPAC